MKAKTIKSVLRNKIKKWLATIKDEKLRELASKNTIVTGGSIASMLCGDKVNDYDIYFRNRDTTYQIAEYYITQFKNLSKDKFKGGVPNPLWNPADIYIDDEYTDRVKIIVKSIGVASEYSGEVDYRYFESEDEEAIQADEYLEEVTKKAKNLKEEGTPYRPIFLSTNAITLSNKVQIVTRFHGEPQEIHENYDFIHCCNYWTSWDNRLVLRPESLEALITKELRYVGSKYPLCSLIRTRKFIKRGWTINAGQYLKMAMQLNNLDLNDINVLEEQLTGVDQAYLKRLYGS